MNVGPIDSSSGACAALAIRLHYLNSQVTRSRPTSMIAIRQVPSVFRMAITDGSVGLSIENIAGRLPLRRKAEPGSHSRSDQCACGLALTVHGDVYNEEAFRYLLAVERKRFERSNQHFVLVLAELEHGPEQTDRMDAAVSARIFAGLTRALRETDVIGWYREGRVAGAVLTHLGHASLADASRQTRQL